LEKYPSMRSLRYGGAWIIKVLNVRRRIFNSILRLPYNEKKYKIIHLILSLLL